MMTALKMLLWFTVCVAVGGLLVHIVKRYKAYKAQVKLIQSIMKDFELDIDRDVNSVRLFLFIYRNRVSLHFIMRQFKTTQKKDALKLLHMSYTMQLHSRHLSKMGVVPVKWQTRLIGMAEKAEWDEKRFELVYYTYCDDNAIDVEAHMPYIKYYIHY